VDVLVQSISPERRLPLFFMEVEAKGTLRSAGRMWPKEIGLAAFTHPRNT
jgi:hypothetical protein